MAEYARAAAACIEDIVTRDRVPVLTGGTGLYLKALRYPMTLGNTPAEPAIRAEYQAFLSEKGTKALHDLLAARDPASAARLHPNDTRRVIRALEVYDITGLPFSAQALPAKQEERYNLRLFAPSWPREALYNRIDSRVDGMVWGGLFDEVQSLLHAGVPDSAQSMQGLGYQEAIPYLMGRADREGTISLIKRRTRNYAKRQLTWFRKEQGLTLLDAGGSDAAQLAGRSYKPWRMDMPETMAVLLERAEEDCRAVFATINARECRWTNRVLHTFQEHRVAPRHFAGSTGYGYADTGRDTLESIVASLFRAEAAIVRPQLTSGTHTLSMCLFGLLQPGDHLLSAFGKPYDTLDGVIGMNGEAGSLREMGVGYGCVMPLASGAIDVQGVLAAIRPETRVILVQRSRGYAWRRTLSPWICSRCLKRSRQ